MKLSQLFEFSCLFVVVEFRNSNAVLTDIKTNARVARCVSRFNRLIWSLSLVSHRVFMRDWYGKITSRIRRPRQSPPTFIAFIPGLLFLRRVRRRVKTYSGFFTVPVSILRSRTSLPPSFECSLYATNRYRAFRFVLRSLRSAYFILLFFQWYELSARMTTFQRDTRAPISNKV